MGDTEPLFPCSCLRGPVCSRSWLAWRVRGGSCRVCAVCVPNRVGMRESVTKVCRMEHETNTPNTHYEHPRDTSGVSETNKNVGGSSADPPRVVTMREAAELCGTTRNAIRGRVERGSLRSLVRDGVRVVPLSELKRAGLYPPRVGGVSGVAHAESAFVGSAGVRTHHAPLNVGDMIDRLIDAERRAAAAEQTIVLSARSESTLTEELRQVRERVVELEVELEAARVVADVPRRRWFGMSKRSR